MTVVAGDAVKLKAEMSDKDLIKRCMKTLKKIFKDEVGLSSNSNQPFYLLILGTNK